MNQQDNNQNLGYRREEYAEDEIDLLELWRTLLRHKKLILLTSFSAAFLATGISLLMPNVYRADVLLAPVQTEDIKAGGLASALGGIGGLASMAGISLGGGGSSEENLAVLQSREFLWRFVQDKKLMPTLFEDEWDADAKAWKETNPEDQPGQMDVYRLFIEDGVLKVDKDTKTELVTVSIEWTDAALATEWANDLVARLNQYLSQQAIARSEDNLKYLNEELMRTQVEEMRKTLYDLIAAEQQKAMLANTQKDFAFKVIDPAVTPDKKAKPKRTIMVILAFILALFLSMGYVFVREGMAKRDSLEADKT